MARQPKRGALIGCGFFAQNHMHAWAGLEGACITALCDSDRAKAEAMAAQFGIEQVYDDALEMFAAERFDFVDIATTVESHRPLVELAAKHTATVICQKPFAETLKDARAMVEAARVQGASLIIHENFRWELPFLKMKQLLEDGEIGVPHFAHFSFRHGFNHYVTQPYLTEVERFAIMDVGLHLFDVARHFMGEVRALSCTTQSLNPIVKGEDSFTALMQMESGATTICDCSFFSRYEPEPFPNNAALIEGDLGTLELDRYNRLKVHKKGDSRIIDCDPDAPDWGGSPWHCVQDSVINFQAHALDVMEGRALPQPSGEDNLRTMTLALAAYDAAETSATVDVTRWSEGS